MDLPLTLHDETRYIQGENDVKHSSVHEGQLVRAALLPMGEELVALVVEVVPEEAQPPGGAESPAQKSDEGLQGDTPPAQPSPVRPEPPAPDSAEPVPLEPAQKGDTTEL